MSTATTFPCGQLVNTTTINDLSAENVLFAQFVWLCLTRHKRQDWGDCDPQDKALNDQALNSGQRILSVYLLPEELRNLHHDPKIWILTEADRSATTVLFPPEY